MPARSTLELQLMGIRGSCFIVLLGRVKWTFIGGFRKGLGTESMLCVSDYYLVLNDLAYYRLHLSDKEAGSEELNDFPTTTQQGRYKIRFGNQFSSFGAPAVSSVVTGGAWEV